MESESKLSWMQTFIVNIVKAGTIPRHIAYIMDGNRRFARSKGLELIQGHKKGYDKLMDIDAWCRAIGIYAVTVYAFSIENFKRSKEEVDGLLKLLEDSLQEMNDDVETWIKRGVQFRIVGRLELFNERIQYLSGQLMQKTLHCNGFVITLAAPYTARDEMTGAIHELMDGVGSGIIEVDDISEELMERCLLTKELPPVDMIVRTSGEMRFSDFMLWQSTYSYICFTKAVWPEYGFLNFIGSILSYQVQGKHTKAFIKRQEEPENEAKDEEKENRIKRFFERIDEKYLQRTKYLAQLKQPHLVGS